MTRAMGEPTRVVTPQETHEVALHRADYFEQFTDQFLDSFDGLPGSDVESWFHQVDAAFRQIGIPEGLRLDLAESLLKGDAFDSWYVRREERDA